MNIDCQDLMGKAFRYGGRGPLHYDCYGLMIELNRRLGRHMPHNYLSSSDCHTIQSEIQSATDTEFVELAFPRAYSLVTFFIVPRITSHIGMVLPDLYRFIHILEKSSVSIDRLDQRDWGRRITGYWEHVSWA